MKNPNKLPECHTCLYFNHITDAIGTCHLNPPVPIASSQTELITEWEISEQSITWETNFCSHHTAK